MNALSQFIRVTLTGGVLFLLPVVVMIVVFTKAHNILVKLSGPLSKKLPELFFGLDGSNLLAVFLLVLLCFISGLIFRSPRVRKSIGSIEENILSYVPGYTLLKSIMSDAIQTKDDHNMTTVLVKDGDSWNIGFLVEENGTLSTVFIPEAPRHDSGEIKIVPSASVRKMNITTNKAARSLQRYGKGAVNWTYAAR